MTTSFFRKAMLPVAIFAGLLMFFGATAVSTPKGAEADHADICAIFGPEGWLNDQYFKSGDVGIVKVGAEFAVWVELDDDDSSDEFTVTTNNIDGAASIIKVLEGTSSGDLVGTGPTSIVHDVESEDARDISGSLLAQLEAHGYKTQNTCGPTTGPGGSNNWENLIVLVVVRCDKAGLFNVSFASEDEEDDTAKKDFDCRGGADSATITRIPESVEIIPAFNNVSHSLVFVSILDASGKAAFPGDKVIFQTDRCSVESSGVDTSAEFTAALTAFQSYNVLVASSSSNIEESAAATATVDAQRQYEEVDSVFITTGANAFNQTRAATVLGCNPVDAPGATPGIANITAIVDRASPLTDLLLATTVRVVGPVVASGFTVTAAPTSLICGEKATIEIDLKDAAGQPVSDHTLVEAVTNFGGVLAGTGAVAGFAGPVVPISSTVAATFGGKATFFLLTSDNHVGKYEVVVTTGGAHFVSGGSLGGFVTSAPLSVQVTVECRLPAAAAAPSPAPSATVVAPSTGGGHIIPPSTGDAGLATSSSNSLLFALAGALALVVAAAGMVAPKFLRD